MGAEKRKPSIVETQGLTFTYPDAMQPALNEFSATFGPSKLSVIIGPNGSGKSTLAKLLIGYLSRYSGTILIDGEDIRHLSALEQARHVSFVPQDNRVTAPITVREAVELGRFCHLAGGVLAGEKDNLIVEKAIEITGLREFGDRRMDNISGGEKQRAMIARALAQDASNMVLDEPTANLDLKYQPLIFDVLRRMVDEDGYNVIAISHDVNLASRYADEVFILKDGQLSASGSPSDVVTVSKLQDAFSTTIREAGDGIFIPMGKSGGNEPR